MFPQIYFCNKILHVSDSSSVHHQEFFTVHTAMVSLLKFISGLKLLVSDCSSLHHQEIFTVHTAMFYIIAVFYSKDKFEKIYHI